MNGFTLGAGEPFGYFPLSSLSVAPISGVGDDTISNFSLGTPVVYGGENYSSIGVVSNGYVVLGGGTSSDIVFSPQHFPNPARPNTRIQPDRFAREINATLALSGAARLQRQLNAKPLGRLRPTHQPPEFSYSAIIGTLSAASLSSTNTLNTHRS